MIFWKLCYKISPFWAFFLEFFGLGNNLTLQDHYYTRAITLILGIERNKKIIFQWGFSCKTCKNSCEFLAPQDKILARFLTLAKNTSSGTRSELWNRNKRKEIGLYDHTLVLGSWWRNMRGKNSWGKARTRGFLKWRTPMNTRGKKQGSRSPPWPPSSKCLSSRPRTLKITVSLFVEQLCSLHFRISNAYTWFWLLSSSK